MVQRGNRVPSQRHWARLDQRHDRGQDRGGNGIGSRFLLLIADNADSSTKEAANQLCESHNEIVELRTAQHKGITLVRPDGYVAYTASHSNRDSVTHAHSVLEHQTT